MSEIKPGDQVFYSPHEDHALDPDHNGDPAFRFVHADGPHQGEPVTGTYGRVRAGADGRLRSRNGDGHAVRPAGCRCYWPATVVRVNGDGSCDLDVRHPVGCVTLHYPDRAAHPGAPGVRHDPAKRPHTFHLPGE